MLEEKIENIEEPEEEPIEEPEEGAEEEPIEEPEEGVEEPEEEEAEVFEVSYKTADGKDITESYTSDEIADLIFKAKSGDPSVDAFIQEAQPVLTEVQNSELIRQVMAYRRAGYSDEQIMRSMGQIVGQATAKGEPAAKKEYETLEEEIEARLEEKVAEKIKPLVDRMQKTEMEYMREKAASKNSALIEKALGKMGLTTEDLTQDDMHSIVNSFYTLWPQANWDFTELTAPQANVLIKDALRGRDKTRRKTKSATAPNVVPARGTVNVTRKRVKRGSTGPKIGTTIEQRAENVKKLLG